MRFYSFLVLLFLCFIGACASEIQNHGFSVELINPNSPRSPFYNIAETKFERVSNYVKHSNNRAKLHSLSFNPNNISKTTLTPIMGSYYVMSYSIGTPPVQQYGILDTGSNSIWLQCKPCKPCSNQTTPLFDATKSSTYKTIPCSSPTCKKVENGHCSFNDKRNCEFNYAYGDGSVYSQGEISLDTLTLTSKLGSSISFPKIVIGCGHKDNFTTEGYASGIVGLGPGPLSLISQLGSLVGGKFSYCMVPLFSKANVSGNLNFGDGAIVYGPRTVSIPIINIVDTYATTLEAISVGDHIIKLDRFSLIPGKKENTIIDSGTTITYFPHDVYSRLEYIVASMIKLKRVNDPTQQLSLCYKTTPKMLFEVPIITVHFSGGDVKLNALNTFIPMDDEVVCFAFLPNRFLPGVLYGNVAQQNFLVGYDIVNNVVSFMPTDCTIH